MLPTGWKITTITVTTVTPKRSNPLSLQNTLKSRPLWKIAKETVWFNLNSFEAESTATDKHIRNGPAPGHNEQKPSLMQRLRFSVGETLAMHLLWTSKTSSARLSCTGFNPSKSPAQDTTLLVLLQPVTSYHISLHRQEEHYIQIYSSDHVCSCR